MKKLRLHRNQLKKMSPDRLRHAAGGAMRSLGAECANSYGLTKVNCVGG